MLLYEAEKRRQARARADLISDIGLAYTGVRDEPNGGTRRAMTELIELLRKA